MRRLIASLVLLLTANSAADADTTLYFDLKWHDQTTRAGQTEYAILAGGIAVMVAVTLPFIAGAVTGLFESAARAFGG